MGLTIEAENAKKALTDTKQAKIFIQHEGKKTTFRFTREEFDQWTEPDLLRTRDTVNNVLHSASLSPEQIDVVLPVGGSTKMPQVRAVGRAVPREGGPSRGKGPGRTRSAPAGTWRRRSCSWRT